MRNDVPGRARQNRGASPAGARDGHSQLSEDFKALARLALQLFADDGDVRFESGSGELNRACFRSADGQASILFQCASDEEACQRCAVGHKHTDALDTGS
jgi:hypothetical protein